MDHIWGSRSSDVLLAHVKAAVKKSSTLKKTFPKSRLSVLVTHSALSSVGMSAEQAVYKIKEVADVSKIERLFDASVTIPKSELGDHYVEFGNHTGRYAGETTVSGLRIEI